MGYWRGLVLFLWCWCWSAQALQLEDQSEIDLLNYVRWQVTDTSVQLSTVRNMEHWQELDVARLQRDLSLWGKVDIGFEGKLPAVYYLSLENPYLDKVDVIITDVQGRILYAYQMGALRDPQQKPVNHRNILVPLEFSPGEQLQIFIKIVDDGPAAFELSLRKRNNLLEHEQFNLTVIGAIVGALLIMAAYFMITYVLLHSPTRFWFSLACAGMALLFMNMHGLFAQINGFGPYISMVSTALVAWLIFCSAKVSHGLMENVPFPLRTVSYVLAGVLLLCGISLDAFEQILASCGIGAIVVLLHLLLALVYRNRTSSLPNRLYILGWLTICSTAWTVALLFANGKLVSTQDSMVFIALIMGGVVLLAVAIGSHERLQTQSMQQRQQGTIAGLSQFYDMFRNSVGGLFTSTLDGRLLSINPAMCELFGYDNEQQFQEEVKNIRQLYADIHDRERLIAELLEDKTVRGREIKGIRRDGSELWFSVSVHLRHEHGEDLIFGSLFDVTERKQSDISLEYLATHDSLTGVINRREFEKRLHQGMALAGTDYELTLLYLDLDQFKVVNDTCGHKAGDVLIKQLSSQLNQVVSKKGTMARLGGDEFGVLLEDTQAGSAYALANQLLNQVQQFRFVWESRIFTLGVSIGMVNWRPSIQTAEQLLSMADAACYMAKEQGRNQVHVYSQEDERMQRYESELNWVSQINKALQNDKFELFYQHYHPLNKLIDGHHYEILLRMQDEQGNLCSPNYFLPAAERYNLTAKIDRWVIEHYFAWLQKQPEHLQKLRRCNINLSGHSLADKELRLFILRAFEQYSIPHNKICFEITESMAILKMEDTLKFIKTFQQLGCAFALDDFGSGFSSYGYLKSLPVAQVKIDGSFVKDLLTDPIDMAMVTSIKDVAQAMGMETVAEYVETPDLIVALGKIGVDYAQGYAIAKPRALSAFSPYQA